MTLLELDQLIDRLTSSVIRAERKAAEDEIEPCEGCGGKEECEPGCRVALEARTTFEEFFSETRGI